MLTYADDYRIMTDVDMENAKCLSRFDTDENATTSEHRLMACVRLLLGHIEGITDGAIKVVEG